MAKTTKRAKATRKPVQAKGAQKRGKNQPGRKSPPAIKSAPKLSRYEEGLADVADVIEAMDQRKGRPTKSPPAVKSGAAINASDNTHGKTHHPSDEKPWLWKPGHCPNPSGRPKSARSKVSESFLEDLHELWSQKGADILAKLAEEKPGDVVRAVVALLPKEVDVAVSQYDTMTDDQLWSQVRASMREARELGVDVAAILGDDDVVH